MRILVTGAFGFLGGRLAQHFANQGHDLLLGSRRETLRPSWLEHGQCVAMAWGDPSSLSDVCAGVDLVLHAAGMNAQDCASDPEAALAFNGGATGRLAGAAASVGVPRFVYLSTGHVYAAPLQGHITEDHPPLNPHPYATSHLAGERALAEICSGTVLQGLSLRLSNSFGAPTRPQADCWMLLVNDLCRQVAETGALRLGSPGAQQRDFLPISALCSAVSRILGTHDWSRFEPCINLGSGRALTVLSMAKQVQGCAERVFGRACPLNVPKAQAAFAPQDLHFVSSRWPLDDVVSADQYDQELQALLRFCERHFGRGS